MSSSISSPARSQRATSSLTANPPSSTAVRVSNSVPERTNGVRTPPTIATRFDPLGNIASPIIWGSGLRRRGGSRLGLARSDHVGGVDQIIESLERVDDLGRGRVRLARESDRPLLPVELETGEVARPGARGEESVGPPCIDHSDEGNPVADAMPGKRNVAQTLVVDRDVGNAYRIFDDHADLRRRLGKQPPQIRFVKRL